MCNGTVVRNGYDDGGYGNFIIMKDSTTNMGFLYGHLREPSPLNEGDSIVIGQYVGHEGETGHATGIHVHVEMQDLTNHTWQFQAPKEVYTDPTAFMGFPNVEGISVIYNGTPLPPTPPEPTPTTHKNSNKWLKYKCKKIFIKGLIK